MKKKILLLFVAILSVVGISSVNAATNLDGAKYNFVINNPESMVKYFDFVITGATFNTDNTYEVYFSHQQTDTSDLENGTYISANVTADSLTVSYLNTRKCLEEAGDIYVWVRETEGGTKNFIASGVKVERPELMLSTRIAANFTFDVTRINVLYPSETNYSNRDVTYKIGLVTDLDLVRALNTDDETALKKALDDLMAYAKADAGKYTGTIKTGDTESITKNMGDLVDKGYYYAYLVVDTDNGKYYQIEDVNLYQAVNCDLEPSLNNYTFPEFEWPEDSYSCEVVDGIYYGKDGNEVSKDVYEKECGEVVPPTCDPNDPTDPNYPCTDDPIDNPDTNVHYGFGIAFIAILFGFGTYLYLRKEGKFPQA